jgi:4-amino-4-deoxy-L-arabinose transferase-like glycosyltransferase
MRMRWMARHQLLLLLSLALAVRVAGALYWQAHHPDPKSFGMGDSDGYFTLGRALAEGRPYEYGPHGAEIFRAPGYPLLLAPVFWLTSQHAVLAARLENALLGTLVVAAVWWLARQLFGPRGALLAAAMAALYPESIAISAMILSDTPFCALMLLQLGLWTAAWKMWEEKGDSPHLCEAPFGPFRQMGTVPFFRALLLALAAGLVAGAATLVRPSWLLFTPLAAMAGALLGGRRVAGAVSPRWRQAVLGVAMLLPLALVMTPWWQRSYDLTGKFVPTTLQVGASLYDGLNPQATGASDMKPVADFERLYRQRHPQDEDEEPAEVEYRLDHALQYDALGWLGTQPAAALRLAGIKFLRTWNLWPNEASFSAVGLRAVVAATYLPLLILGLLGAVRTLRGGWPYWLCWFPAVYFTALHVVFVGSIRYRQPAMLALMVLAAGVATGWKAEGEGRKAEETGGS